VPGGIGFVAHASDVPCPHHHEQVFSLCSEVTRDERLASAGGMWLLAWAFVQVVLALVVKPSTRSILLWRIASLVATGTAVVGLTLEHLTIFERVVVHWPGVVTYSLCSMAVLLTLFAECDPAKP
jgi:hypothetical protein